MPAINGPVQVRNRQTGAKGPPASMLSGEVTHNAVDGGLYVGTGNDGSGNATGKLRVGQGGRVGVADAAVTVSAYDTDVQYTSLSAARVVTLPAANAVQVGTRLTVGDESGSCSSTNTITINPAGTDKINGAAAAVVLGTAYGQVVLRCDGTANWLVVSNSASAAPTGVNGGTF